MNSFKCSRRKRSSPILPRSTLAHSSSRSGCNFQSALYPRKPLMPTCVSLPNSSNIFWLALQICANWSSSWLGVDVIIHLPPVLNVGDNAVQNSRAMFGLTNANSSKYANDILKPRPVLSVVACATIRLPLSNSILPLL